MEEEKEEASSEDTKDSKTGSTTASSNSKSDKPKRPSLGNASAKVEAAKSTSGKGRSLMDDVEAGLNDLDD